MVPPAFADFNSALLRGNGCSGLFMGINLLAGSLPIKAPGWMPGRAVNSDYTDPGKDVKKKKRFAIHRNRKTTGWAILSLPDLEDK